ncbi:hypothetical protein L916_18235 [Phytophthora nicotianae]|uniref:Uncharacterized protein n=1 Tax=Phytophthora nicotianae TaxID=4792 RepID=W2I2K6_PHYNI|nr:hypothetical protein L916_18235 [Phytophthora nicotianae]
MDDIETNNSAAGWGCLNSSGTDTDDTGACVSTESGLGQISGAQKHKSEKMKDRDVSYANLDPVCMKTLICGMSSLARVAERIVRTELSERFGLILNGWTHASKYYIAVYSDNDVSGVIKTLLCMIPLLNEDEPLVGDADVRAIGRLHLPPFLPCRASKDGRQ